MERPFEIVRERMHMGHLDMGKPDQPDIWTRIGRAERAIRAPFGTVVQE